MTFERRRVLVNFDWFLFFLVLLISVVGIMTIYSATRPVGSEGGSSLYLKQMLWLSAALMALILTAAIDYSWYERFSGYLFLIGIVGLGVVLIFGKVGMGARRWLQFGPVTFQPSELFKILFVILIATKLSKIKHPLHLGEYIRLAVVYLLLPAFLIAKEPDLGSALILVMIFLLVTIVRGFSKKALVTLLTVSLISVPFLGNVIWSKLKTYQRNRIVAFMKPDVDPSGIGYQIEQSKISVGSGRIFGKGYLKGTQGPFRFLPEKHTDFILAIFAEEWGFLGTFLLILLYLLIMLRGIDTALKAKDEFGRFLAFAVVSMFFVYFFINVGMVLGMLPVVGVPLPFMSYGGTALVSNFAAVGLLINVRMRRFSLFY